MGAELRDHRRPPPGLARVQADVQRTVDAGEVRLSESSPSATRFRRAGRGRVEVITFKPLSKNPGALHYLGDTLYPNLTIAALKRQRTTGVVAVASTIHNQDGELVLEGEQKYLMRLQPAFT